MSIESLRKRVARAKEYGVHNITAIPRTQFEAALEEHDRLCEAGAEQEVVNTELRAKLAAAETRAEQLATNILNIVAKQSRACQIAECREALVGIADLVGGVERVDVAEPLFDKIASLEARLQTETARAGRIRDALRHFEWGGVSYDENRRCPECRWIETENKHAHWCFIGAALGGEPKEDK